MAENQDKEIWIFLSHSNEDYEKVCHVRNLLEEMNTRPLMFFLKCLNDNDEIEDLIKREIAARTRFILCDSENARKSNWVAKEIEYITELHKPYEIIDITAPENIIREAISNSLRKEHLFLSYPRELSTAINVVEKRLNKYDFCSTFIDMRDLSIGSSFIDIINRNIDTALNSGKFIPVLSKFSIQTRRSFTYYELERAITHRSSHDSILPIYLDEESKFHFQNILHPFVGIDLYNPLSPTRTQPDSKDIPVNHGNLDTDYGLRRLGNDIANAILVRLQGWGNLETYAEQFRFGTGIPKDLTEAENLAELIVDHWECVDAGNYFNGPGMLIKLAGMFKKGRVVKQDLDKAKQYYSDARAFYGVAIPPEYL